MNILQVALEEMDNGVSGDTIRLEGPLAETYTEALKVALDKDQPLEAKDNISQESFMSHHAQLSTVNQMLVEEEDKETNNINIVAYTLKAGGATKDDVKLLSTMLANGEEKPNEQFVIITDTSLPEVKEGQPNAGQTGTFISAIESLAEAYNVRVFRNLPSFVNVVRKR